MCAWSEITSFYNLTGAEGPERVPAKQVSSTFFQVLGINPVLGRTFSAAEDQPGDRRVAVISHSLWEARYGRGPLVIGKTIILDGQNYTVIGVLPAGFRFSTTAEEIWTPLGKLLDGGPYTKSQVLELVTSRGLRARTGKRLSKQSLDYITRDQYYAGSLRDPWTGQEHIGRHTPMISQSTFDAVQRITARRDRPAPVV